MAKTTTNSGSRKGGKTEEGKKFVTSSRIATKHELRTAMNERASKINTPDLSKFDLKSFAAPTVSHPIAFPEHPMTLSTIQEGLLDLKEEDMLSMSLRLSAKTDIRAAIRMIQDINTESPSALSKIPSYILDIIVAYGNE